MLRTNRTLSVVHENARLYFFDCSRRYHFRNFYVDTRVNLRSRDNVCNVHIFRMYFRQHIRHKKETNVFDRVVFKEK